MEERRWFPFRAVELEVVLGVVGFGVTVATLLGVPGPLIAAVAGLTLLGTYLAGLSIRAGASVARVHLDAAFRGRGYASIFRRARSSLLLMHVDDDAPDPELLGLYSVLLDRGVQVRRLVFVRHAHHPDGLRWIDDFGDHPNLTQRVIQTSTAPNLSLSFAIIDEVAVLLALPGYRAAENEPYSERLVLRNLVELRKSEVTRAFLEVYEAAWRRGTPLLPPHARQG